MKENEFSQLTSDDILTNESELEFGVNAITALSGMDFKQRVAVLTLIIQEHGEINRISTDEFMDFNMSLFLGFVHNAPDCEAKNNYIDNAIEMLLTMKNTNSKLN